MTSNGGHGTTNGGTQVPAPPMMILFGMGAAAILGRRKFKAKKTKAA